MRRQYVLKVAPWRESVDGEPYRQCWVEEGGWIVFADCVFLFSRSLEEVVEEAKRQLGVDEIVVEEEKGI